MSTRSAGVNGAYVSLPSQQRYTSQPTTTRVQGASYGTSGASYGTSTIAGASRVGGTSYGTSTIAGASYGSSRVGGTSYGTSTISGSSYGTSSLLNNTQRYSGASFGASGLQSSRVASLPTTTSFGAVTSGVSGLNTQRSVQYSSPTQYSSQPTYSSPVQYSSPTQYSSPVTYSSPQGYSAPRTYLSPTTTYGEVALEYVEECVEENVVEYVEEMVETVAPVGNFKVCVVGGAGGIGQPLSLLMAMDPNVAELNVYDLTISMVPAAGVGADLSHINKRAKVSSFSFDKDDKAIDVAGECLTGCDLVLVPAGVPRKPGQDRKDLIGINCGIAKNIVEACARYCPNAVIGLIVNPVNSVVPAMTEMWKRKGLDPRKIAGVTTLDCVRAAKFVNEITGVPIEEIDIPVIGGHAGVTILPLFSQDPAASTIPMDEIPALDEKVQNAGTVVVQAKNGKGSATLSMAFAGARFGSAVLKGLAGQPTTECAYVESPAVAGINYFTSKVTFGLEGVEAVHELGPMTDYETQRLEQLYPILQDEINDGLAYAAENDFA